MGDKFYKELGKVLKDVRIAKRITQEELAKKVGVTRNCITNWETGRRKANIVELINVCKALGANVDEILDKVEKYVD